MQGRRRSGGAVTQTLSHQSPTTRQQQKGTVMRHSTWQRVSADDVPILETVRCTDHRGGQVVGIVVDVMRQHGATAFIVRDATGHHHAIPVTAQFEIRNDAQ